MDGVTTRRGLRPYRLRAVLFDFDGTLTHPGALDFPAIKREIGCPQDTYILEFIDGLPAGARRDAAVAALERFELEAAAVSHPNAGAEELVRGLRALGLRVGVITRNGRASVDRSLANFATLGAADFDVLVTRDDDVPPKPAPDGVVLAAARMGVAPAETLMVGDFLLDMQAGRAAGTVTAYLTNGEQKEAGAPAAGGAAAAGPADTSDGDIDELASPGDELCDFVVGDLAGLDEVVRLGLPLPAGKLPNDLLERHLRGVAIGDPDVLIAAGVGQDVAVLDMAAADLIVVHGDPITLAGSRLGRYSVLINMNDILTSGGEPRWLLATVLLPPGTTGSEALALLGDIADTAAAEGIALIGGHTEVTDVAARPLVSATMIGKARRNELREKRDARAGDRVLMTKAAGLEGTALLAEELGERLRALGMTAAELAAARALFAQISVAPEARLAVAFDGVRALHDVTEGGLATALEEFSAACGREVTVHTERVLVLPETRRVCELLGADPLGLIGSGSLLIACDPRESGALGDVLHDTGIAVAEIGELGQPGAGVIALTRGVPAPWPHFAADEAARLLAGE